MPVHFLLLENAECSAKQLSQIKLFYLENVFCDFTDFTMVHQYILFQNVEFHMLKQEYDYEVITPKFAAKLTFS